MFLILSYALLKSIKPTYVDFTISFLLSMIGAKDDRSTWQLQLFLYQFGHPPLTL